MKRMRLLFLLFLVFGFSLYAACPAGMPQTDVYYINGIWTSINKANDTVFQSATSINPLKPSFLAYMAGKAKLPYQDCVTFTLVYNASEGVLKDLLETFGLLTPSYSTYLAQSPNSNNINLANLSNDIKVATVVTVEGYADGLRQHLSDWLSSFGVPTSRPKTRAEQDVENLVNQATSSIKAGHKVVLIGHSEGNLFANAAYDNLIQYQSRHFAGTNITLPDINRLEVIGVATPGNRVGGNYGVSDNRKGKQRYTTHCLDFIQDVPNSLPYNALGVGDVGLTNLEMCATHQVLGWISGVQTTMTGLKYTDKLAKVFLGQNPGVTVNDAKISKASLATSALSIADWIMSHATHFMDAAYMNTGSPTRKQIMRDLEDTLPDPACGNDLSCSLKDDFRSADYTGNWNQISDNMEISNSTAVQSAGILQLETHTYLYSAGGMYASRLDGHIILRSRRVFTGQFTSTLSVNHIGGGGSTLSLKKATDNNTVLALTINNSPGQNSVSVYPSTSNLTWMPTATNFGGWHVVSFVKTDTQVVMSVGGIIWATSSSASMDGYYLEISSQGDNTLHVKDLLVVRKSNTGTVTVKTTNDTQVGCQLTGVSGPILAPTNAISVTQGSATLTCTDPTGYAISSISPNATQNVVAGQNTTFMVNLTAVKSSMSLTPTTNSITVEQGKWGNVDLVLKSLNGMTGNPTFTLYCIVSCPAGFSYERPNGVSKTALPANGTLPIRVSFYPTTSTALGNYHYQFKAVLSGITVDATMAVNVVKASSTTPNMSLTPTTNSITVEQGKWGNVDLVLKSLNGMTGNPTFTLYCIVSCPAGFSYERPNGVSKTALPANGTLPIRVSFYPTTSIALGTYNFQYNAALSGVTVIATMAVNVVKTSASSVLSVTLASSDLSPKVNTAVKLTATPSGGSGTGYSCNWNVSNSTACQISYTPTATGNTNVTVTAKDSTNKTATASVTLNVQASAPTTGTVSVSTTNNVSVSCSLNSVSITAPTTLSSKPAGSYALSCTAPSGYTITGISPSPTQTLLDGATVNFAVGLKSSVPSLSNVSCSVSSTSVQTGTQITYIANWSGGSGSPGFNWSGNISGTTRSVNWTYNSPGTYSASVLVMDNGQQLSGQCPNVTVTAPPPPPPSLSVFWFWFSPDSPKTTDTITLNFNGTGFNSSTQVWVFGLNCASGCQAGVVASSVTSTSMKALAQLRNVDNFQIKLRNGSSGNFVLAGTLPVR